MIAGLQSTNGRNHIYVKKCAALAIKFSKIRVYRLFMLLHYSLRPRGKLVKKALYSLTTTLLASFTSAIFCRRESCDFALIDNQGTQHHMAWYDDQNAVVILPQAVGATDTSALSALEGLKDSYAEQRVVFFLMNPGMETDREAVSKDLMSVGTELPCTYG